MIIDALSSFVPDPEAFAAAQRTLARMEGYLEHFDPKSVAGKDRKQIEEEAAETGRTMCPTEADFFAMLDKSDVSRAGIYNELYATSLGVPTSSNDAVARYVAKRPDRLFGIGGVDPWDERSIGDMERSVGELGIRAFILSPFKQKLLPTDNRLSRVFGRCESLGVPILLHTGINWWRAVDYDIGHPRYVDGVANAFPKLKILAVHCAWPWVMDMMMVAWRHPNVYVDISAHRPKHLTLPGAGWEPLLQYGARMLSDRVIFGSTWTLLQMSIATLVAEVRELPLKDGVADKWLGQNAARFFNLD
jgi:predicted TIM-barrel fold metal-dependent hydrolase